MKNKNVKKSHKYSMERTQGTWQHFIQCDEVSLVDTINVGSKRIATMQKHDECCVDAEFICKAVNNHDELFQMVKDLKNCIKRLTEDDLSQYDKDTEAQWEGEAHELLTRINPNYYQNANEPFKNNLT